MNDGTTDISALHRSHSTSIRKTEFIKKSEDLFDK